MITGAAREAKSEGFLTRWVSGLDGSSCLFRGPCSISVPEMADMSALGASAWLGMLHSPSKARANPTLCSACPPARAPGHAQLLPACVGESPRLLLALEAGVCWPGLCSFVLQGLTKKDFFPNQKGFL